MNIAIIPARGGSRRIPRKNIRQFFGKPIIAYSVEAAWDSGLFDQVVVSTDCDEIAKAVESVPCTIYRRPDHLSRDEVGTLAVVGDAARHFSRAAEYVCCIYATAPMLLPSDIVRGFNHLTFVNACHCVSVGTLPLRDAAQFYWSRADNAKEEAPYYEYMTVLEVIAENRICDINTEDDFKRAEAMYAALHPEAVHG